MIYTHVLNRGPGGVRSPADRLPVMTHRSATPSRLDNVDAAHDAKHNIAMQSRTVPQKP